MFYFFKDLESQNAWLEKRSFLEKLKANFLRDQKNNNNRKRRFWKRVMSEKT